MPLPFYLRRKTKQGTDRHCLQHKTLILTHTNINFEKISFENVKIEILRRVKYNKMFPEVTNLTLNLSQSSPTNTNSQKISALDRKPITIVWPQIQASNGAKIIFRRK